MTTLGPSTKLVSMLLIHIRGTSPLPHVIRDDRLVDDRKASGFGTRLDAPLGMPVLLLSLRLLQSLETLGWQTGFDLIADGAEAAEGGHRVRPVVLADCTLRGVVVGDGGDACRWGLEIGVCDHEVARDVGAQRREDLRSDSQSVWAGGRHLLNTRLCGLHDGGILNEVGVNIVHPLIVPSTDCVYLRIEIAVGWKCQ